MAGEFIVIEGLDGRGENKSAQFGYDNFLKTGINTRKISFFDSE